jgi:glycosyltransferase involved in cell wall biosynthesis
LVRFAGGYDRGELRRLMAAVDWVVVPSIWWENSPLVIEEALAHKRPVICSDIGGMAEKVRANEDGLHFPVGDSRALAALILRASGDGALWRRLRRSIRRPITVEQSVSAHLKIYRDRTFAFA